MQHDDEARTPRPGEDPYEFDWPDDAKAERASTRARASARDGITPVNRVAASAVLGLTFALLFVLPIAVVGGVIGFFIAVAAPIILAGLVVGLPVAWLLDRVTRGMPRGVPEVSFLVVGGVLGYGLTFAALTGLRHVLFDDAITYEVSRSYGAIFMMTATAGSFLGARMLGDRFRYYPKQVRILTLFILVIFIMSVIANFAIRPA